MKRIIVLGFVVLCSLGLNPSAAWSDGSCSSTISSELNIHVPALAIGAAQAGMDLQYDAAGPAAEPGIWFSVAGVTAPTATGCTNPAGLLLEGEVWILRIPVLTLGASSIWAELQYVPTDDGHVWFKVTNAGAMPHRVFVTSTFGNGDLSAWTDAGGKTGLEAADAICQARADAGGLSGEYRAWLSDDIDDAYCRMHSLGGKKADNCGLGTLPATAGPWVRMDGFPFAGTIDRMTFPNREVFAPVWFDEYGHVADAVWGGYYFTNTGDDGASERRSCSNWASGSNDISAGGGTAQGTTESFTSYFGSGCGYMASLLCVEIGAGPALPDFSVPGKKVFVTSVEGNGNLSSWSDAGGNSGIAAGDAICRARALAGGLSNPDHFKAWLSDDSADALDRLTSNGPWVRLDGVLVAENKADLVDESLFTAIALTELDTYVAYPYTWTGTYANGSMAPETCLAWTSSSGDDHGHRGIEALASKTWTDSSYMKCNESMRIYCFED